MQLRVVQLLVNRTRRFQLFSAILNGKTDIAPWRRYMHERVLKAENIGYYLNQVLDITVFHWTNIYTTVLSDVSCPIHAIQEHSCLIPDSKRRQKPLQAQKNEPYARLRPGQRQLLGIQQWFDLNCCTFSPESSKGGICGYKVLGWLVP